MSAVYQVKCDICGRVGDLSQRGWRILRDFAYVKHACPRCADETDNYGGSHLHESRLADKVRDAERNRR